MTSESTRFFGQPNDTKPIFIEAGSTHFNRTDERED
jgi:hypothetical protein